MTWDLTANLHPLGELHEAGDVSAASLDGIVGQRHVDREGEAPGDIHVKWRFSVEDDALAALDRLMTRVSGARCTFHLRQEE